ncbi:MAG: TVP38/TMEM64 family protein [Woeseiaceae bacterium]
MKRAAFNRLVLVALFAALVYALYVLPIAGPVTTLVNWAQANPLAGGVAYIVCVVIATVLFIPGSGSMMIAGYVFGFTTGTLLSAAAITLGAQCAFLVGRLVARDWVAAKVSANRRLVAIEAGLREEAFLIVVLTRLSLVIPFNLLNYAYGITAVRGRTHLFATAAGMLVPVALYVYLGTLARDIGQILSGAATPTALGYWILSAGIVGISLLTWVMHRAASRALDRHLPAVDSENA